MKLPAARLAVAGYISLPAHTKPGGFDHADAHSSLLYVAHTANDTVDVIDMGPELHLRSLPNLKEVAGVLVSRERRLVFTSNRGENTVAIFSPEKEDTLVKVPVGIRPNGLAYDPIRDLLLAANVGTPDLPDSFTVSIVNVAEKRMIASVPVSGRTRWAIFDPEQELFFVNIAAPAEIVAVSAVIPDRIARRYAVPAAGPHGLGLDSKRRQLFCACDAKLLVSLDATTGAVIATTELGGAPDVIFFNPSNDQLYVAIGQPGSVEVFDTTTMRRVQTFPTEDGAKTMAFDAQRQRLYVFLPTTHRALVLTIGPPRR